VSKHCLISVIFGINIDSKLGKQNLVHFCGRQFVKRFALCYRTADFVCLSVMSVTLVYCGQTVGCIKMQLGREVGLGPGDIVLDRDPPAPKGGGTAAQHFAVDVYRGKTAGWIKMSLGMHIDLCLGHIALDGAQLTPKRRAQPPIFGPCLLWPNSYKRSLNIPLST